MSLDHVRKLEIERDNGIVYAHRLAELFVWLSEMDPERKHYWRGKEKLLMSTAESIEQRVNYLIDRELRREA